MVPNVRIADRVALGIERLLADDVADQPGIGKRRSIGRRGADPISCVWLEQRRRQTQERLLGAAPVFTARREIIVVAADVAGQEIRIVHLREKKIDVFRAELDRAL